MMVVSDASPICYLLLIGEIKLLTQLYCQVLISSVVQRELSHERSPHLVQNWINNPPPWLIIESVNIMSEQDLEALDASEKSAIILAEQRKANLIIIDDGLGRDIARFRGLRVTGLLGVLDEAAKWKLVDFSQAITFLKTTIFSAAIKLLQSLLQQYQYYQTHKVQPHLLRSVVFSLWMKSVAPRSKSQWGTATFQCWRCAR
jgi:predicted nucleic acid-binding protein